MTRRPTSIAVFFALALAMASGAAAQEEPASLRAALGPDVPETVMPAVDNAKMLAQDAVAKGRVPLRFAITHDVKITPAQGRWDLVDDTWIWRVKVTSRGAKSINLGFTTYWMPAGGALYIYESGY